MPKWSDIVYLYKKEGKKLVKKVPIDYQTLCPNNFGKQNVQLVVNIFNEITIEQLEHHGKKDTARFVSLITRTWKILNIKTPDVGKHLSDPDRQTLECTSDPRLEFLHKMASSIKLVDSGKRGTSIKALTSDTANIFHQTLYAIVHLIKVPLDSGYDNVISGKIQSGRLEAEFGIYRGSCENYFISVEQVVSSLNMQRLKLNDKLEIQQNFRGWDLVEDFAGINFRGERG